MSHLYRYRLRSHLRDRVNMFWTIAFPLLLCTFMQLSIGSLTQNIEQFRSIPVAYVQTGQDTALGELLTGLSDGDSPLLLMQRTDREEALRLLEEGTVKGVIEEGGIPALLCQEEGLEQSILKSVLDRYVQVEATVTSLGATDQAQIQAAVDALTHEASAIHPVSFSSGSLNYFLQSLYAVIAMTCIMGGFFGLNGVLSSEPRLSALGVRRSVSPARKSAVVLSDLTAAMTVSLGEVLILLLYLRFVLGVDFGVQIPAILLLCVLGSAVGVALGMLVGLAIPVREGVKSGILIALSISLSFLGGMMDSRVRVIVEQNIPLLNRVNPAALMVDSFYVLDTYGAGTRFYVNVASLFLIFVLLCGGNLLILRRKQYASV